MGNKISLKINKKNIAVKNKEKKEKNIQFKSH